MEGVRVLRAASVESAGRIGWDAIQSQGNGDLGVGVTGWRRGENGDHFRAYLPRATNGRV